MIHIIAWARTSFRSKFIRNWSYLVTSSLAVQVLGMVATFRIARVLAPAGYGQFNLVQTTAGLGVVLAGLGFRNVLIREVARNPEKSGAILFAASIYRVVGYLLVSVGLLIYNHFNSNSFSNALSVAAIALVGGALAWDLIESLAFGHEQMEYSSVINLAGGIIWVTMAWVTPARIMTPVMISLSFALLQCAKSVVYAIQGATTGYFRDFTDAGALQNLGSPLLKESIPFYWLVLLTAAVSQLPILFLAQRSGVAEVALYNVGYRLVNPLQLLVTNALTVLYPALSQARGKGEAERFIGYVRKTLFGIVLLGTLGALVVSLMRTEIVSILFGAVYLKSANAMAFQCWYTLLLGLFSLIGIGLAANNKQRWLAVLSTVYTLIATPILWWGSARGATGLAEAMLIVAIVNMSYHLWAFQKSLPIKLPALFYLYLSVIVASGAGLSFLVPQGFHWAIRGLLSLGLSLCMILYFLRMRKTLLPVTVPSPLAQETMNEW